MDTINKHYKDMTDIAIKCKFEEVNIQRITKWFENFINTDSTYLKRNIIGKINKWGIEERQDEIVNWLIALMLGDPTAIPKESRHHSAILVPGIAEVNPLDPISKINRQLKSLPQDLVIGNKSTNIHTIRSSINPVDLPRDKIINLITSNIINLGPRTWVTYEYPEGYPKTNDEWKFAYQVHRAIFDAIDGCQTIQNDYKARLDDAISNNPMSKLPSEPDLNTLRKWIKEARDWFSNIEIDGVRGGFNTKLQNLMAGLFSDMNNFVSHNLINNIETFGKKNADKISYFICKYSGDVINNIMGVFTDYSFKLGENLGHAESAESYGTQLEAAKRAEQSNSSILETLIAVVVVVVTVVILIISFFAGSKGNNGRSDVDIQPSKPAPLPEIPGEVPRW